MTDDRDKLSREELRAGCAPPARHGTFHRILVLVAVLAVVLGAVLAAAYLDLSIFDSLRRALSYDKADAAGENTIVYSPGSNAKVSAGYVQSHRDVIAGCAVLGLCLESPLATVISAAQTAHDAGVTVLFNDSPFMDELPHELVEAVDILLVNQHEVAQLLGMPDEDVSTLDWYEAVSRFSDYGFDRAVVTLGASGSVVIEKGTWHRVSAVQVKSVDATGCGDAFMGTLLAGLAAGNTLLQSAQMGSYVSAYAATKLGAQSAYGTVDEIVGYFDGAESASV